MNERQPTKAFRQPKSPTVDPAHAPGKRHLSRGTDTATRAVDQHQQQRMPRTTASVHNRRAERGRS